MMFDEKNVNPMLSIMGYKIPYSITYSLESKDLTFENDFILILDRYLSNEKELILNKSQKKFIDGYIAFADSGVDNDKDKAFSSLDNYLATIGV